MFCRISVQFGGDAEMPSLGKGVISLLEGIERGGTIRQAAIDIGMAYSKAWTILNHAERDLGVSLIIREPSRGSKLTADGKRMISLYRETMEAAQGAANKVFAAYLAERESTGGKE